MMPETTTKSSTTSTTTVAPAAPEAKPGAAPEVLALAGTTIKGDGQFEYRVLPDATFEVTKIPPTTKPEVMGRKLRPDNEFKDAWQKLTDRIVADAKAKKPADAPAPQPTAPTPQPTAPAKTPVTPAEPSIGTMILDGISSIGDELSGMVDAGSAWLEEFLFGPSAPETETPTTEAPTTEAPAETAPPVVDPAAAQGKENNLDVAVRLKGQLHQGYSQDPTNTGTECKDGLIGGNAQDLDTLNCGQFTAAVLGEAGYDLNKEWIDPATGLPVAYVDGTGDPTPVTFVTAFMLVNAQKEATGAILDAQSGPIKDPKNEQPTDASAKVTRVEGETRDHYKLATGKRQNSRHKTADGAEPAAAAPTSSRSGFLVATANTFVGLKAEDGQKFGAGAAAELFGGAPVDDGKKRMPGDIQQRFMLDEQGNYTVDGHSSTVYAVKGTGTCYFDPNIASSAKPADGKLDRAAGWYTGVWIIDPTTDRKYVSTFELTEVQMIDANFATQKDEKGDKRTQAVAIGQFFVPKGAESIGRLPTSHWLGWKDNNVAAVEPKPL
jgi:hypothetical protein